MATPTTLDRMRCTLITLGLGGLGGLAFWLLSLPLPWMLGAAAAVMAVALSGLPVHLPFALRNAILSILGILLGATFSWEVTKAAQEWGPTLAFLLISQIVMGAVIVFGLYRWLAFPSVTAYLAGTPGIMSQAIALAGDHDADIKRVSLFHATRLVCLVAAVPVLAGLWLGSTPNPPQTPASTSAVIPAGLSWIDALSLFACAGLGALTGRLLKLPSPFLMGPMFASAALHITGLTEAAPPALLVNLAQLVIGAYLGTRFAGSTVAEVRTIALVSVPVSLFMLAWTCAAAGLLAWLGRMDYAVCLLILTPGALSQMSLVALALDIEPAMVATHHAVRVCTFLFLVPLGMRVWTTRTWPLDQPREPACDTRPPPIE